MPDHLVKSRFQDPNLTSYSEVAIQVWQNMQQNCKIDWDLKPAHNYSQHGIQQ